MKKQKETINANNHRQNVNTDSCSHCPPPPPDLYICTSRARTSSQSLRSTARHTIAPPGAHWPGRTGSRLRPAPLESKRGAALWGGTILPRTLPCLALARNTSSVQASERERRSTASINRDRGTRTGESRGRWKAGGRVRGKLWRRRKSGKWTRVIFKWLLMNFLIVVAR